jgi:hypothetical protein
MRRLLAAVLLFLASWPGPAMAQTPISVGTIRAERDCRLFESDWGAWLILECRNNFAALRQRLQSALVESGRFTLGAGRGSYVVSGTITELGISAASSAGADYHLAMHRATASFDLRVADAAGRTILAATLAPSVEVGSSLTLAGGGATTASSAQAVYDALQRAVALAAARAVAFRIEPLQVAAVSGRRIRLNYGAPLLEPDTVIQVTDANGFPARFRVTETMQGGAVAESTGAAANVAPGAAAILLEGGGPGAGVNRFERVELPGTEEIATGGSFQDVPREPAPVPRREAPAPAQIAERNMNGASDAGRARPRLTARRGEAPIAAAGPAAGRHGPRVALVIGISNYGTIGNLTNPVSDARALAAALHDIGFDVELVLDPDQRTMKDAISRLGGRMSQAGNGSTGLFYFAGHGIQSRGINYLIPARAVIRREADLELEAVGAETVLSQMQEAGQSTNIIILDACRNMPLTRSFRSGSQGLAPMDAPNGSFIAYSTGPGQVAADGTGANSPFATALLREISQPGQPIEAVFRNVRREVLERTEGLQTPWDSSSLVEPFFFRP